MFKGDNRSGELNGFLDKGCHLKGDLSFDDTFRIDGKLTGKVSTERGELIVGKEGIVDGEMEVALVHISGQVRGILRASQKIEIAAGARVRGEIYAPSLIIAEGAFFEGACDMTTNRGESKKVTSIESGKGQRSPS